MSSRDALFAKIAAAVADRPERRDRATLERRLTNPEPNLIPARADRPEPERLQLFVAKCEELGVTVHRLASLDDVPDAVAAWLKARNLSTTLRAAPAATIRELPWQRTPMLKLDYGAARIEDQVGLTPAAAGIAETGTLVTASGPETPPTLNFVPDNHIVLLRRSQIVRAMEDAFALLRQSYGAGSLPRTVNLISGPSRTGDVEQKIVMGAHGPRRLHVLLVDDVEAG